MSNNIYHYTHIIRNTNNQMKYIGVRSCNCLPENDDGYMGSSKTLNEVMKIPHEHFTKTIIDTFPTRELANVNEHQLYKHHNVAQNPEFYNLCNAPMGFWNMNMKKNESPTKKREKALKRFNAKVIKTGDCHEWNASKQKQGYGMFSYDGKSKPAHRFSYLLHKGDIAENMVVHQTCENNGCVNPNHLELQTKSQNKKNYNSTHVSKSMVEKSSVKFLYRLRSVRPELEKEIDALLLLLVTEKMKEDDDFGFEKIKKENYI